MSLKIEAEVKLDSEPCVLAWSENLFVGTEDGFIRAFDSNLKLKAAWQAHSVQPFALAAAGDRVYSTSNDGGVRVWSPAGERLRELPNAGGADIGTLRIYQGALYTGDEAGNVMVFEKDEMKASYGVLEEIKDMLVDRPFMFTVRDLDVTVTEIKPDTQLVRASLPIGFGGLGIRRLCDIPVPAFLASAYGVSELVSNMLPSYGASSEISHKSEAMNVWESLCPGVDPPVKPSLQKTLGYTSKCQFITRHTMEGRAPIRLAGSSLILVARDGKSLRLHHNSIESKFELLQEVQASEMIVTSIAVSEDGSVTWTAGWDGRLRRWKIEGSPAKLRAAGELELGGCVNGLACTKEANVVIAAVSGGKIVRVRS